MQAVWKPAATGNFSAGRRLPISQITFHHIAGDAAGAIARFQTAGVQVSATYVIGSDGKLYQCVKEGDTPYTDANGDSNARSITIEHAGGHPLVPYTEAMYKTSIELVADLVARYGITSFKRHRDVSDTPTACPGTLDVDRIIKGGTEVKIGSEDNWRARFNRLHHQLVRNGDMPENVFKSIVGQEAWKIVEQWSDHSESTRLLEFQQLGEQATTENWLGQIADFKKQVAELKAQLAATTSGGQVLKPGLYKVN